MQSAKVEDRIRQKYWLGKEKDKLELAEDEEENEIDESDGSFTEGIHWA